MLVPIKTGIVGEGQEELLEQMGIPMWEIDRMFNYTLVRPSVVRETLLSYGAELKLWFTEKMLSKRANGTRRSWEVDMGRLEAKIGTVQLTPDNELAGDLYR